MPFESPAQLRRNRELIRAWVERLREANPPLDNPEIEAASWYRGLSEDQRTKLESDVDRLWSDDDSFEGLISGPFGELLARFPTLFRHDPPSAGPDPRDSLNPGTEDLVADDVASTFRAMERADPFWAVEWNDFLDGIDEPEEPEN